MLVRLRFTFTEIMRKCSMIFFHPLSHIPCVFLSYRLGVLTRYGINLVYTSYVRV